MVFIEQNGMKASKWPQAQSNPGLCFSDWYCDSSKLNSLSQNYYPKILDMLYIPEPTALKLLRMEFYFSEKVFKQIIGLQKKKELCQLK
jgi:hypothetical protein